MNFLKYLLVDPVLAQLDSKIFSETLPYHQIPSTIRFTQNHNKTLKIDYTFKNDLLELTFDGCKVHTKHSRQIINCNTARALFRSDRLGPTSILIFNVEIKHIAPTMLADISYSTIIDHTWHTINGKRVLPSVVEKFIQEKNLNVSYTDDTKFFQDPMDELIFMTEFTNKL